MIVYFDGDVVLYVLSDVLFGVIVVGDIGCYFLDIDDKWKGVDSCEFFKDVYCCVKV